MITVWNTAAIRNLVAIVLGFAALSGCGGSGPFDYVRASGNISYDDGSRIPGEFKIVFMPVVPPVGTAHPRQGIAEVDANGHFDCVTSHKYGDGLVPGKQKVAFMGGGMGTSARPLVPKECMDLTTTPLEVDTAHLPFDIKVPKPGKGDDTGKSK